MAIEILSGEAVLSSNRQTNKQRNWPTRRAPDRIYPIATPMTDATFRIDPKEKIFCIGSCFANELGKALHRFNYHVLSTFNELPTSPNRAKFKYGDGIFHKYNVASIFNELSWALNPQTPYRHDYVLIETNDHLFQDYQLAGQGYSDNEVEMKHFREAFNRSFAIVKSADVVILTLGLSEVWFDKETQLYMNVTAPPALIRRYPQRFELHVFDYGQTLSYLNKIYDLLTASLAPDFRLLVTVSPVPLLSTFRNQDVLVANTYSKSVLRAAVEQFVGGKTNVNYFPSYEFVTLSNPLAVWRHDDFRHVDPSFVDFIMANVMTQYTNAAEGQHEISQFLKAKSLYYGNFIKEAKATLKPLIESKALPDKDWLLLWSSLHLNFQGKYKIQLLNLIRHFKTYRHLSIRQHIDYLRQQRDKAGKKRYLGHIDIWEEKRIAGWACHKDHSKSIKVQLLNGKDVITEAVANLPRPDVADAFGQQKLNSGFEIPLDKIELKGDIIRIVFAETGKDLPNSPIDLSQKVAK